jgi:hypothetical protein
MKGTLGLVAALALAALAGACGSPPTPETPPTPTTEPGPGPAPTDPGPAPTGEPGTTPAPTGTAKAPAGPASQPVVASKMLEEVKKLGVDVTKTPDLAKLAMDKKKKIMPLLQKSLGFEQCTGCHVEGDMKAKTRNRDIAAGCWKTFVAPMRDDKGGPIFCDSCHNGKNKILNRADVESLKKFMETEYEHKLTRGDKKENACSSCHGEALELKIFDKIWKVSAK